MRINATPSDLPFKSTGLAIYPEPPQFGQLSGSTLSPPRVIEIFPEFGEKFAQDCFPLRIPNKLWDFATRELLAVPLWHRIDAATTPCGASVPD
jgi:hypothetical protein